MADTNNHTGESSDAAPAAQPTPVPAQPTATHQPAAYGQQTLNYNQYPNAYGQQYQGFQQYGYQQPAGYYAAPYAQSAYPQAVPESTETKFWVNSKMALHGTSVIFSIITLGMGISLVSGSSEISFLAAVACPVVCLPTPFYRP